MFEFGFVCDIKPDTGYVRVKIPEFDNITTEFIPFLRTVAKGNSESLPIEVDQLVVVGRTCSGRWFVVGAAPNDVDVPYTGSSPSKMGVHFSDGCLVEYDIANQKLTINTTGEVDITALVAKITSPAITLTGDVLLDGELTVNSGITIAAGGITVTAGNIETGTGDIKSGGDLMAGVVSFSRHIHNGVQPGEGSTGIAENG